MINMRLEIFLEYGGNMRNQFFDPVFLFDFYSDMGSTATPSALSN